MALSGYGDAIRARQLRYPRVPESPSMLRPPIVPIRGVQIPTGPARVLTCFLLVLLFVGTLMPGGWKRSAELAVHAPGYLGMVAHVLLFAGICFLLPHARPWEVRGWHVLGVGLALALLTEGLQFFAVDRHPEAAGLLQDMTGAVIGWMLGRRWGPSGALVPT
jgi:hypothetical protein